MIAQLRALLGTHAAAAEADLGRFVAGRGQTSSLGYDAIEPKGKRRAPSGKLMFEERELMEQQRRLLVSGSRDVHRNFAVAAWAIRKHLDFVSAFNFHPRTPDEGFNRQLEERVEYWSSPEQFDAAGRHGRRAYVRLLEGRRCCDGDVLSVRIADGTSQAVEGDRLRNPLGQMDTGP